MSEPEPEERHETQFVYLTIPAELYLDREIFPLAKLLWGRIKTFCLARHKACTASNRFLADELGINERTIRKLLTQLKAHELLLVDFKTEEGRTQRRIWALGWDNDPRPHRAATPRPSEAATPRPSSSSKDHSNKNHNTYTTPDPSKEGDPQVGGFQLNGDLPRKAPKRPARTPPKVPSEEFKTFFNAYPRGEDMKKAWVAWWRAEGSRPALPELLEAVRRAKKTDQWKRGFVPLAATWINGERWDDDL